MANLKSLAKDTAIYGLSSIVGRFLNYLMVPLYTHCMPKDSGDYGVSVNIYAYTALILVILIFGMETTLFRFANKEGEQPDTVFATATSFVSALSSVFLALVFVFIGPISTTLGYAEHPEYLQMMSTVVALDAIQAIPFSYLRFKHQAIKFASLKMLFILLNILLNMVYFLWLGKTEVIYIFGINLCCTAFITLFFIPDIWRIRRNFSFPLLRRMLGYSWPILILGVAGVLNQTADKIIFPLVYPDAAQAQVELGVYGACIKIAMIMALITQAFRYAYEPIVFSKCKDANKGEYYAAAMKYFIIFALLAYLCVIGYLPILQYLIGDYREGMHVIPIVMAAEIMMGVYFNLSFWYKLIDRTIYGALFSLIGCAVLFAVNIWGIPHYGYVACAWGGFAGYGTAMLLSYIVGQIRNPIPYPLRSISAYLLLAGVLYIIMEIVPEDWGHAPRLAVNTLLIAIFALYIIHKDLPLKNLPFVGQYFRNK